MEMTKLEMRELTNIDIFFIIGEIEKELIKNGGGRLDQYYDLNETSILRFKTKNGKKDLVFSPPKYIFLRESQSIECEPSPFAASLKNLFSNRLLTEIRQINEDRIIELVFENDSILLECMKKGNILLIQNSSIKNMKNKIEEKDRKLFIGEKYIPPQNEKKEVTYENIIEVINKKELENEKIVVAITRNTKFPAFYLNKIFESENWDPKQKIAEIDEFKRKKIAERLDEFYKNVKNKKVKPAQKDNEIFLIDEKMENKGGYLEINLFKYMSDRYNEELNKKKEAEKEKRINRLLDRLKHQEEHLRNLEIKLKEEKEKGEWIIKNAEYIRSIIEKYKEIRKNKNKEEMERFLKENKIELTKEGLKIKIEHQ